jgi:hypothetical protein
MSSVSIPEGWTLTLYDRPNGQGRQKKFVGPIYCPCFLKVDWDGEDNNNLNDKVRSYVLDTSDGIGDTPSGSRSTTPPPLDSTPLITLPPEPENTGMSKQTMVMIAVAVLVCFLMMGGSSFMMMMM